MSIIIYIIVKTSKDSIKYKLVSNHLEYGELINNLKTFGTFQTKFYKENEYFRFVYDKKLYRLYKRIKRNDKDISFYLRFFTSGDSIKDEAPLLESKFSDISEEYKDHKLAIEEKFVLISENIKNIFKINNTSLEDLYGEIKIKEKYNLKGIYK